MPGLLSDNQPRLRFLLGLTRTLVGACLLLTGCASATSPTPGGTSDRHPSGGWDNAPLVGAVPTAIVTAAPAAMLPTVATSTPAAMDAAASSSGTSPAPPSSETFAGTHFPPAAVTPPHRRTQKPGDGQWLPLQELAAEAQPSIYVTTLHPHKIKGFVYLTVLAIDRQAVDLTLMAGKLEPKSDLLPDEQRPAVVPASAYDDLLMVLNGGFKTRHGNYGMRLAGVTLVPPKEAACTVAQYRDGRLRVRSWQHLAADTEGATPAVNTYRQTPPCLVEQGQRNPELPSEFRTRLWGAAQGGARDIRRSALGLDESGRTLYFALGDWITAGELADAMIALGAVDVAQLDINWSYTRAFTFERSAGRPKIARSLVPKLKFSRDGYIQKRAQRDFYYLTRRR